MRIGMRANIIALLFSNYSLERCVFMNICVNAYVPSTADAFFDVASVTVVF